MRCLLPLLFLAFSLQAGEYRIDPSAEAPPTPPREFRGAWVASVHNIDWPSRPGLSGSQQRAELTKLLDLAAATGLNAIILQVRPEGDALYKSKIEPWSYWLTGRMGKAPSDGYDPLEYACAEAHRRGIELHAWFNPFRARATKSVSASSDHMSKTNPEWMLPAGSQTWANPGERAVQDRAIRVMVDVAKRYPVDAVHIDDYFYPYPKKVGGRMIPQFDDSRAYAAYRENGSLPVEEWRRSEIDGFIERLYVEVKKASPQTKVGISPFGIWRPGYPSVIEADLDSVLHISADSRKWLQNGWLDYFSPQLYWRIDQKEHSFTTLAKWWSEQNVKGRHLWPGTASSRIRGDGSDSARSSAEAVGQINATRELAANQFGAGHVHWSFKAIVQDRDGLRGRLAKLYSEVAIPPATPWLSTGRAPGTPSVTAEEVGGNTTLKFSRDRNAKWWLVQVRPQAGSSWVTLRMLQAELDALPLSDAPAQIAVRAIGTAGELSPVTTLVR